MRAAIYARVSTLDQNPENQLEELRKYVVLRGWKLTPYIDHGVSGTKDSYPARLNRRGLVNKLTVPTCI